MPTNSNVPAHTFSLIPSIPPHSSQKPKYRLPSPLSKPLSIDTLRISINLQSLLRHRCILQEVQRHPHEMSLDEIEFLADFFARHEGVVEVALFELVVAGEEGFVVVEGFYWWGRVVC